MKLSDAVSALQLPLFAEVPLLVFLGVFLGVALHVLSNRQGFEAARALPLREEQGRSRGSDQ